MKVHEVVQVERRAKVVLYREQVAQLLGYPEATVVRAKVNLDPFSIEVVMIGDEFDEVDLDTESHIVQPR